MALDDIVSADHPRKGVSAGAVYKVERNAISYDATKMASDEEVKFIDWWNTWNTYFSADGTKYSILTERHMEQAVTDCEIMKNYFGGAKFTGGVPNEGEFGARSPLVEDLVMLTDTEWGKTAGAAWAAGRSAWLHTLAQGQADTTFENAASINLRNTSGSQKWGWTFFGVRSFAVQPVLKNILLKLAGKDQATQPVEDKLRGSTSKMAIFDKSFFMHPDKSFKVGVEIRTAAIDPIAPYPSIIWLTGTRAIDISYDRPSAA